MKNVKASKESAFHQTKFSSTVLAASLSFLGEAFSKRKYKFKYLPLSALADVTLYSRYEVTEYIAFVFLTVLF